MDIQRSHRSRHAETRLRPWIETVLAELAAGRLEQALAAVERRLQEIAEGSRRCSQATTASWEYLETDGDPSREEITASTRTP
ncbi:MAG TPA: hypothetical protein VLA19_27025 [Herpetosiphonaceae bacterium]|nr:hypothetical protein [Herpetosiphonaceae bacterium]